MRMLVHTAINTRGFILDYIKKKLPSVSESIKEEIHLETPGHDHSVSWIKESLRADSLPDLMLCHANDLDVLEESECTKLFADVSERLREIVTIRKDLHKLIEPPHFLFPVYSIPLVMIYNRTGPLAESHSNSWRDLLNSTRKVIFPDKNTPISKAMLAMVKKQYPDRYDAFLNQLTFGESPVEVIQQIAMGKFDLGISNLSFSMMAKQKKIEINMPSEGAVPLPQILLFKKDANPETIEVARILFEENLQTYLGKQGFWPSSAETEKEVPNLMGLGSQQEIAWDSFLKKTEK